MSMNELNTEIISVGTELLLGHVANTDSRDISEMLSKIGVNVKYHTVVGDNPQRLRDCVGIARTRADIIITTGGLGPTCDDLTKQILAESFGLRLVRDEEEYRGLYDYITNGRVFTENNFNQAMLPEGCTVFHNFCGTAPGCAFEAEGKTVIMLPGPPKECRDMFMRWGVPYLKKLSGEQIVSHSVRIFGIGESGVDSIFAEDMNRMTNPTMAPYAKECDCLLQITAKAESEERAEEMIAPVMEYVKGKLGDWVYGVDVECVEEAAMALLNDRGMTVAVAEQCTGGEVSKRITDLPGGAGCHKCGIAVSRADAMTRFLDMDGSILAENGVVSRGAAEQMAQNVRRISGADVGLAVVGVDEQRYGAGEPVGTLFTAMAAGDKCFVRELHLGTQRTKSYIRRMAGNHLFDMLRRYLTGLDVIY